MHFWHKVVSAALIFTYAMWSAPVFAAAVPLEKGSASWYRHKGCLCAASPDFPKGTKLRVTNQKTGKSVIVTVNDYGPNRKKYPNRAIDLDAIAFQKIARLSQGLVSVTVDKVIPPKQLP